jgi:hypothetical protein
MWTLRLAWSGIVAGILLWAGAGTGMAQTFNSGSTGADGAFNPTCTPTPCTVQQALPASGVFNFTTINIPTNITVKFTKNQTNTPVTMLATGNVTINGIIDVSGSPGTDGVNSTNLAFTAGASGPGGFDGGNGATGLVSSTGGAGLGPGGGAGGLSGSAYGGGGGFAAVGSGGTAGGAMYGTASLLPLIGGSGGGAGWTQTFGRTSGAGGGGGGALLIASSGTITLQGGILRARGGNTSGAPVPSAFYGGGGSGGAIRLVATAITGTGGTIDVAGGTQVFSPANPGAGGRVGIEAFTNTASINFGTPAPGAVTVALPSPAILPTPPTLTISSVAGVSAPASPGAKYSSPDIVVPAGTTNPMTVALAASQVPLGTTITVTTKPENGAATSATSTGLSGTVASSTATASLTIATDQPSVLGATVSFRLVALGAGGPVYVQGEPVEWVRVTATLGGRSRVVYVMQSGRGIPLETLQ